MTMPGKPALFYRSKNCVRALTRRTRKWRAARMMRRSSLDIGFHDTRSISVRVHSHINSTVPPYAMLPLRPVGFGFPPLAGRGSPRLQARAWGSPMSGSRQQNRRCHKLGFPASKTARLALCSWPWARS